ncbi:enoyl-CoA hydratase [Congregibacter sp.]|uniref:enoyl-CoA hydratase n=1 Tax=Congregibacter sp. TaxID=2744308 RepID=UPI003F6D72F9
MSEAVPNMDAPLTESTRNNVRWITLDREKQRNPLSLQMLHSLIDALERAGDDPAVRAIVIAANGPVFSAGHDLREMSKSDGESRESQVQRMREILDTCSRMMLGIVNSPKAIIACVQGTATAAGCQLVSACDLAIAADSAKFCTPGVNMGGFCTTPLVGIGRNVHRKHAMALALTGDAFSAEDAVRFGLINECVPGDLLVDRTTELAERIAAKSAQGIRHGKADFYRQVDMPIEDAFAYANEAMVRAMTSPDAEEGKAAFFEKRTPNWGDA